MSSYISSNDNRYYVALESSYGQAAAITASNRIPAVKLTTEQRIERAERKDKTGSRTFAGFPAGGRRSTKFELRTYLTSWTTANQEPGYGPLIRAALGGAPGYHAGGTAAAGCTTTQLVLSSNHGLEPGQAVSFRGEIRFVQAIVNPTTVLLNAPLSAAPSAGDELSSTVTYGPATDLPSTTVLDCWSPTTAVQRLLTGAAVDKLKLEVNGDFHEIVFSGGAADLVDSASFEGEQAGLSAFPVEPAIADFDYSIVPGNLGQAWLGSTAERFLTLTGASVEVGNDLEFRNREFGSSVPRSVAPGQRRVTLNFSVFEKDDDASRMLYQASRQGTPIGVMLQLGEQQGQLCGVYVKSVIPEVPQFDDGDRRVEWHFKNCRAQGSVNDDIYIAFG